MRATILLCLLIAVIGNAGAQKISYPDKNLPGATPRIFAPGLISGPMSDRDMAISPTGDEILYTIQAARGLISVILELHRLQGVWSKPSVASFSGRYNDIEPAFSADGQTLYFASNRPVQGGGPVKDYDIWMV